MNSTRESKAIVNLARYVSRKTGMDIVVTEDGEFYGLAKQVGVTVKSLHEDLDVLGGEGAVAGLIGIMVGYRNGEKK